jgi:hypothetical protein
MVLLLHEIFFVILIFILLVLLVAAFLLGSVLSDGVSDDGSSTKRNMQICLGVVCVLAALTGGVIYYDY